MQALASEEKQASLFGFQGAETAPHYYERL
jgi:hypothetical protein